jgi:hypothetical protein
MGGAVTFNRERDGFRTLSNGFDQIRSEFQDAVLRLFTRFDTRIRENRFVVGGALEIIVGAAFRACGVNVLHRGATEMSLDLIFEDQKGGYSIKSMLRADTTRLINVLGHQPSVQDWQAATLFLIPSGIVYADPALPWWQENASRAIRARSDALEISRKHIEKFAGSHPNWTISCSLSVPPGVGGVQTASLQLASVILLELKGTLFSHLPPLLG